MQPGDTRVVEPDVHPTAAPDRRHSLAQRYHLPAVLDAYVGPFHDRSSRLSEQSRISLRAVTLSGQTRTPFSLRGLAPRTGRLGRGGHSCWARRAAWLAGGRA